MALTGNQKNGYTDGDQIGNWGEQFPIFARVKGNELYAVAREDNANHPTPGRFGKMFFISKDFLKQTVFGTNKSDADVFTDKPQNVEDTSEAGGSFVAIDHTTLLIKRPTTATTTPVVTNPTTTPVVTNPVTTTPVTTTPTTTVPTTGLTTTPTTTTSTTTTVNAAMTPTIKWTIIGVAVAIVGAILFVALKGSSNGNGNGYNSRRRNGRY